MSRHRSCVREGRECALHELLLAAPKARGALRLLRDNEPSQSHMDSEMTVLYTRKSGVDLSRAALLGR